MYAWSAGSSLRRQGLCVSISWPISISRSSETRVMVSPTRSMSRMTSAQISTTDSRLTSWSVLLMARRPTAVAVSKQMPTRTTFRLMSALHSDVPFDEVLVLRVGERDEQQDDSEEDEGEDPVDRLEASEVDDEDLEEADREQPEAGEAQRPITQEEAGGHEAEPLDRPGHREQVTPDLEKEQDGQQKAPQDREDPLDICVEARKAPLRFLGLGEELPAVQAQELGNEEQRDHGHGRGEPLGNPVEAPDEEEVRGPAPPDGQDRDQAALDPQVPIPPDDPERQQDKSQGRPGEHGQRPAEFKPRQDHEEGDCGIGVSLREMLFVLRDSPGLP